MTQKKNSTCGCGCMPEPKKGSETSKPEAQKPEKAESQ